MSDISREGWVREETQTYKVTIRSPVGVKEFFTVNNWLEFNVDDRVSRLFVYPLNSLISQSYVVYGFRNPHDAILFKLRFCDSSVTKLIDTVWNTAI